MSEEIQVLEAGKACSWDDIEVGEVFAVKGCWVIGYKVSKYYGMLLADDHKVAFNCGSYGMLTHYGDTVLAHDFAEESEEPLAPGKFFSKLPKWVQRKWING